MAHWIWLAKEILVMSHIFNSGDPRWVIRRDVSALFCRWWFWWTGGFLLGAWNHLICDPSSTESEAPVGGRLCLWLDVSHVWGGKGWVGHMETGRPKVEGCWLNCLAKEVKGPQAPSWWRPQQLLQALQVEAEVEVQDGRMSSYLSWPSGPAWVVWCCVSGLSSALQLPSLRSVCWGWGGLDHRRPRGSTSLWDRKEGHSKNILLKAQCR